ncbi:MAG: hypothetical protein K0R26_2639, partial [Bacteroidota bacterium]|nr:hypothetical protein [Bacteroidota bacterium]
MKKIFILTFYLSSLVSFSQTFILPSSGVQSTFSGGCPVGTCSGTLLDPGGTGNYSNNINQIYQTFCPSTPGNCLQVTFTSFNTESGFDYLTIGNGPAQNSAVFVGAPANASGQIMGTPAVPFSYTSNNSSGCLTFRFRSDFINTRSGFTASLSCVPCAAALPSGNSDACASTFICSNLGINDVSNGPGINPTEGCGGSSCVTGENYSNWYTFSVASSGSLTFTVDPNSNGDDFDYALYGPNVACGGLGAPIRCSYAANTGNTGLGNGASDVSEDVNGNGWTSPLNVTAGQTYKLLVNNWTAGGFGFNLLFGGTAGIGTLPPAVASTSICNGSSTVLTATPVASGGTFTWTPGAINSESITVSPTTTTSYSVAYSMSGCTSTVAVATVTVNNVPTANAGPGTTLTCANPTATLSGSGGGTYAWSGPGITGGGSTANPTINAPGDYSLSVTSSGCTSTISTVSIGQNIAPPVATASNSGTLTCSVPTVTLTGGPASGVSYQWSGPGFSGGTTSQNAVATAAGNYTLTVTDSNNGCSSSTVTTVTQNTTPPVVTASNSTTLTCTTTTAVLSGTGGGTYSWSGPGILSGGNTASPTVNVGGSYTVLVTAANGCTATANTTIIENKTAPVAGASNSSGLTCAITSATLTGSGGGSYVWTGPGIISGASTANPVVNMPGMYSVVVTAANGCTATANTTVSQNTTAPTAGASNSATLTCTAPTATLTGTGGGSYNWTGPGVVSGGTTANPVVNAPGTYSVVVTAANGCTASATTTLTQNASLPVATASNSTILTCTTNTVLLSGGPSSGVSYQWSGPGFSGGTTSQDAIATAPGSYTLVVTNSVNSCTASATTVVSQNTTVPASTATASGDLTCSNSTVTLNSTASSMNYTWTAPAGGVLGSSNSQSTTASGAGGTYSLLVQDPNNGCTYTTTVSVIQNTVIPSGVSAGSNQTLTCNSPTVTLTGSVSSPTNAVVDWGTSVCGTQTTVVTEACAAGIYTLTATDPSNGC